MKLLDISIIIPTRNRAKSIIETIDSIYKCEYIPNEIIIIDQSENKQSQIIKKEISRYKDIEIKYIHQNIPSSTSSRNKGIELAKNEIIVFSDDDIYVEEKTLYNIYEKFKNDKSISLIAAIDKLSLGEVSNKLTSIIGYTFFRNNPFKQNGYVMKSMFGRYPKTIEKTIETEWAMGYFFATKKSILEVGNIRFDENMKSYAYAEDLDFTYRINKYSKDNKLNMIIDPKIIVEHRVSKEWRTTKLQYSIAFIVNREYLSYKLFPNSIRSRIMVRWANIGEVVRRILIKDNPKDIIKAQQICYKYRNEIKNGNIPEDIFAIYK